MVLQNRRRYVLRENIVISSYFSEPSMAYIYNSCRKEKYLTKITPLKV